MMRKNKMDTVNSPATSESESRTSFVKALPQRYSGIISRRLPSAIIANLTPLMAPPLSPVHEPNVGSAEDFTQENSI